jgi:tetratricopeptide (TPR) repeat protein
MGMKIRRDNSALTFGRRRRGQGRMAFFLFWLIAMGVVFGVIWQFDRVQPQVMGMVMGPATATPNAISMAQLAQDAYWQGDLESAIYYYGQAAEMEPTNTLIQYEYVRVLVYGSYRGRGSRFLARDALTVADRTVRLLPNDAYAQAAYALALIENDRSDEAAAAALNAVETSPGWAEARAYLALAYYGQGRYRSAQEQAQQAVSLNPNSIDSRRALALSLAFTGNYDISIQQYQAAIEIHPRLDALYFELAPYYIILDNFDAAIQSYDRVLINDPANVKAWTRKCETFFRQRDDVSAQDSCERAIELDPSFPEAHAQLGMVRYTRRNYEGSIESFETCIGLMDSQGWEMSERLQECYYLHGLAYYRLDRCELAMPLFREALTVDIDQRPRELTMIGMQDCAAVDDDITIADIPTPVPPTPTPPPPIGIY